MSLPEFTQTKPPTQECSICLENVDPDDLTSNGIPNCVTCENNHFIHRECFDKMTTSNCPLCRKPVIYNCHGYHGYRRTDRKGGYYKKKNKTYKNKNKTYKNKNKNKKTKRKTHKKY